MIVVVGTSPFEDAPVVVGPYERPADVYLAVKTLQENGWDPQILEPIRLDEIMPVENAED